MLPDVLQHALNALKSNTLQGRFYRAKQEQRSDVKSSVAGVSAFATSRSRSLQNMVLPHGFSFLLHFAFPLLTRSPLGIPPVHCTRPFAVILMLLLARGLPLWACLWVMVVLSLVFKVSVSSWSCSAYLAALFYIT